MGLRKDVMDIVTEIGKVKTVDEAMAVFKGKMDANHLSRIQQIKSPAVLIKIANAVRLCEPDDVYINTGSDEDRDFSRNWR